jgi:hypothetical protein
VNVDIRIVCCRRGEDDALWTTAGMCEQMGTIADERLCPTAAPPAAVPALKPILASASSTPAPPSPEQMAIVRAHLAESVCCESNGRTSRMSRSECNASIDNSEVDGRSCEPVCCYRGAAQTTEWDSRGNCGGPSDPTSVVVSEDKCEEICCQMPDQTLRRDGRRTCVNRGGSPRALFHCGASVTAMKQLPVTDPERIHAGESRQENVDVDVAEKSKGRAMGVWMNEIGPGREARLPPASPFF